jgi:predicted metalloendopeptidase
MYPIVILLVNCFIAISAFGADAPPAKLKYGTWGFDLSGGDISAKPGDNFFRYANGTWMDKTQIPPDKPGYSLRVAMTDLTEQRLFRRDQRCSRPWSARHSRERLESVHISNIAVWGWASD